MKDYIYDKLSKTFKVTERNMGEFQTIKKNGMKFTIHSYELENTGNYSTIEMSAMFGMMKMVSAILTPFSKDAPLFSLDFIKVLSSDTLFVEFYNTDLGPFNTEALDKLREEGNVFPDYPLKPHWYDSIRMTPSIAKKAKKMTSQFEEYAEKFFDCYLGCLKNSPECDAGSKNVKVSEYVNGLLNNGGPSTDQFIKMIGAENTKMLFSKYVFGNAR